MLFLLRDQIICHYSHFISKRVRNCLSKGSERSVYWNEHKTKSEYKDTVDKYKYFLESNFAGVTRLYVLIYSKEDEN